MKGCGTDRKTLSLPVVVSFHSCQRAGVDLVLVAVGVSGRDFADAVRFSCSLCFPFERDQSKKDAVGAQHEERH